eukprot:737263-Lingulodinium_polyedra.AAC.1
MKQKPRRAKAVRGGDWNIDLLPPLLADPFCETRADAREARGKRLVMRAFSMPCTWSWAIQ